MAPFSLLPRFHAHFQPFPGNRAQATVSTTDFFVAWAPDTHTDPHSVSSGCTLFFYESDGRSGIDHNSIPKHAVWVENSIVQAVPEHPKKDFVFCLSNSLGDAFLFQVCWAPPLQSISNLLPDTSVSCPCTSACFPLSGGFYLLHIIGTKTMNEKINVYTEFQEWLNSSRGLHSDARGGVWVEGFFTVVSISFV